MEAGIGSRVNHPRFGDGVVVSIGISTLTVFFRNIGDKEITIDFPGLEILTEGEKMTRGITLDDIKAAVKDVVDEYSDISGVVLMGDRWKGGKLVLHPSNPELQPKEIPIETFFHKIVMVRDRLRVMEQQINAHKSLDDEEKVNLQQYITRIYGSLTTFNVLFKSKEMQFVGESSNS